MPLSKTKGKGPQLFRGDDSSDDDAAPRAGSKQLSDTEMASASADEEPGKGAEAGASSSKVKGKRKATGRGRTSSVSSTATGKSVALSDTSLADMQAQRDTEAGAAGVEPELDPNIIASIPVYLARSVQRDSSLQVFQYPNYAYRRPLPVPESAAQRGETESARWRKNANWVEVDLPLDIRQGVYNADKGETMGANIADSKGPKAKKEDSARTDPKRLDKVKLTSNHIPNSTRYLIGVIRDGECICFEILVAAMLISSGIQARCTSPSLVLSSNCGHRCITSTRMTRLKQNRNGGREMLTRLPCPTMEVRQAKPSSRLKRAQSQSLCVRTLMPRAGEAEHRAAEA